jgi:succinylglutamate desuccinylase
MMMEGASGNESKNGFDRIIGEYSSGRPGPLLLLIGGMHGNEPAGIEAARRVLERLSSERLTIRGRFLALAGNLTALKLGQRFIESDLNRMWSVGDLERLRRRGPIQDSVEEREQRGLLEYLAAELAKGESPVIVLDLHSTSAPGPPFSLISDTLQNRRIAFAFPVPVILGLEEAIDGALLDYFGEKGFTAVGVEGGQHSDPQTADHHESVIWLALAAGGLLDEAQVPALEQHRKRLQEAAQGLPRVVEIFHRHGLAPNDDFRMQEGFVNFTRVNQGELLAHDRCGEVRSPDDGLLVLPRYQGLGDDGFFLGSEVRIFWLKLSALLRRLRFDRLIALLPGVQRHPSQENALLANPRVTRWVVVKIFHLFGFRKCRPEGRYLVFSRRREVLNQNQNSRI